MVRVLSCYHFRGQKIGRCEEAAAVTVAGQYVVVGIEDAVNVYAAGQGFGYACQTCEFSEIYSAENILNHNIPELGAPIVFGSDGGMGRMDSACSEQHHSGSYSSSVSSIESETEIKLSHSFSTVDLINSISYNKKGNYLLCLEARDLEDGNSKNSNIRVYFHWNKKTDVLQMRTRIAGVSPSTHDLEKPCLTMVEIPSTSPAISVASCNLTGHLASLSADSVINIFCYRIKEVSGRSKLHYADFDRLCAVEVPGCSLDSLSFTGNFISCVGPGKVHIFQVHKAEKSWSPSMVAASKYCVQKSKPASAGGTDNGSGAGKKGDKSKMHFDHSNKVTYDPSNDSVTVHLPSITRANRKRTGNSIVVEEFSTEILTNKSRIIFSSAVSAIDVEDVLRLSIPQSSSGANVAQERFIAAGLYAIRLKDNLGGVTCVVGMSKEALVYHLPSKVSCRPMRITNYSFTAPLVAFTFDSLFFHALTESGLETYTSRSLCYALQDQEGFERFRNACPLLNERPCLVGIRPFVRVRFMAANDSLICLLTCPTIVEGTTAPQPKSSPPLSPTNALLQDERLWTIYSLELPDVDMLFEDTMRVASTHEGESDSYLTLLSELHLILRTCINSSPEDAHYQIPRYRKLCKSIGLEFFKLSWSQKANGRDECANVNQNLLVPPPSTEELLELGVTYLCMSEMTVEDIFSAENSLLTQEPKYIDGLVMLIDVLLSSTCTKEVDKHNFSPSLSSSIVEFLARHSPGTLVQLVIKIPFLRENQSSRLVEILREFTNERGYAGKETVALILTLIALGGVEPNVCSQVETILQNAHPQDLLNYLSLEFILDRSPKHTTLTDVAICLLAVNSDAPTTIISEAMRNHEVSVSEVMLAFAKAVNLNSESQIQRSLAKALRVVLEHFLCNIINGCNGGALPSDIFQSPSSSVVFSEDDRHAALAVVRSYISDITFLPPHKFMATTADSGAAKGAGGNEQSENSEDLLTEEQTKVAIGNDGFPGPENTDSADILYRNQIFGTIPSFVNFLLGIDRPGGSITPSSTKFTTSMFSNKESMDSYIRLLSLLSSPCGKVEGVKDSVLAFVYTNATKSTPLQLILQMYCEPVETAISILISRQPTTVLLYAKEMFEKSTPKWKILVTQLKKRINLNPDTTDSDMFSTIIESVYLHLANTLSLAELEEVLEKGSEDAAKFRSTCKRVELANSYASMVIQISTDYLQTHK